MGIFNHNTKIGSKIDFNGISPSYDKEKLNLFYNELKLGVKNYALFQKFSNYNWPYWIHSSIDNLDSNYSPFVPPLLINNKNRNSISFSNMLLDGMLLVDPVGMIALSNEHWALEFWVSRGKNLYRPTLCAQNIRWERNTNDWILRSVWKEDNFLLEHKIFGARTDSHEAVVDLNLEINKKTESMSLLVAVRPYNLSSIGDVDEIDYKSVSKIVSINNKDKIIISKSPDFILTGSGLLGDIYCPNTDQPDAIPYRKKVYGKMQIWNCVYGFGL